MAARRGGLLGSTWWSLCDATCRAAVHLSEKRPRRRGAAPTGSGYLRGVREKKPPERKDEKKATSKLPPWGGDATLKLPCPEEGFPERLAGESKAA